MSETNLEFRCRGHWVVVTFVAFPIVTQRLLELDSHTFDIVNFQIYVQIEGSKQ